MTRFIPTLLPSRFYTGLCGIGMVMVMCTTTISTLTLAGLLQDPLVQMMMRSDKVSESDHSELLHRVKDSLAARVPVERPVLQAPA